MRARKSKNKFHNLIYLGLFIILVETIVYFAQVFTTPPISSAQSSEPDQSVQITYQPIDFKLPILIYHYVEYVTDERDTIRKSLNIEPRILENQIETLKSSGYTFITPNLISKIENGRLKVIKPAVLSFDDGYHDFYTDVFPILKKHNVKAVAYINPGLLGKLNYMNWEQVKEIAASGFVEIGSHGVTHRSMSSLDKESAKWEMVESKKMLESELDQPITTIAFPYGHHNDQVVELTKSAGYTSALTTSEGTNETVKNKFTLKRIHPGASINEHLIQKIETEL